MFYTYLCIVKYLIIYTTIKFNYMKKLIIAALTFTLLPAVSNIASAKSIKNIRNEKRERMVEKTNFIKNMLPSIFPTVDTYDTVAVDYMIDEHGKPFITYINSESMAAKQEVVKFIESAVYNTNNVSGKIYTMQLVLNR